MLSQTSLQLGQSRWRLRLLGWGAASEKTNPKQRKNRHIRFHQFDKLSQKRLIIGGIVPLAVIGATKKENHLRLQAIVGDDGWACCSSEFGRWNGARLFQTQQPGQHGRMENSRISV
jgi:hypothetical protein